MSIEAGDEKSMETSYKHIKTKTNKKNESNNSLPPIQTPKCLRKKTSIDISNRISSLNSVYGSKTRPKTVSTFSNTTNNEPLWTRPNENCKRIMMFEQPSLDKSNWHFDIISYARHHNSQERARYRQLVRSFDSDSNDVLDLEELVDMWFKKNKDERKLVAKEYEKERRNMWRGLDAITTLERRRCLDAMGLSERSDKAFSKTIGMAAKEKFEKFTHISEMKKEEEEEEEEEIVTRKMEEGEVLQQPFITSKTTTSMGFVDLEIRRKYPMLCSFSDELGDAKKNQIKLLVKEETLEEKRRVDRHREAWVNTMRLRKDLLKRHAVAEAREKNKVLELKQITLNFDAFDRRQKLLRETPKFNDQTAKSLRESKLLDARADAALGRKARATELRVFDDASFVELEQLSKLFEEQRKQFTDRLANLYRQFNRTQELPPSPLASGQEYDEVNEDISFHDYNDNREMPKEQL